MDFERITDAVYDAQGLLRKAMEWDKWVEEIPYIRWPATWEVKAIPPFSGVVIRYLIRRPSTPQDLRVSVYLDCYGMLASIHQPYWEVYPGNREGDEAQCFMGEVQELLRLIEIGLESIEHPSS